MLNWNVYWQKVGFQISCRPMTSQQIKNLFACRVLTSLFNAATSVFQMYESIHPNIYHPWLHAKKPRYFGEKCANQRIFFLLILSCVYPKKICWGGSSNWWQSKVQQSNGCRQKTSWYLSFMYSKCIEVIFH